jgi:hypothetical protein
MLSPNIQKLLDNVTDRIILILDEHILQSSTVIGITGFYIQIFHPEHLIIYTTAIHSWLLSKKG